MYSLNYYVANKKLISVKVSFSFSYYIELKKLSIHTYIRARAFTHDDISSDSETKEERETERHLRFAHITYTYLDKQTPGL